jgi:hypothetical protein
LTQWEGPSLEGLVGFLLLLDGIVIIGYYFYGAAGSAVALLGLLIGHSVVGGFRWKNHPRLTWRKSWPAFRSSFWRTFIVAGGVFLLLILVETLIGRGEINGVGYHFIYGMALIALGVAFEIIGRKKPAFGLGSSQQEANVAL